MRIEDAYKWLYHATLGADHAVDVYEGARAWMRREWAGLGPAEKNEPLMVALDSRRRWLRINLRPYRASGGDPDFLSALFFSSAQGPRVSIGRFREEWERLGEYLRRRPIGRIDRAAWERLDRRTAPKGYPPIHHSRAYSEARSPAYRVIRGDLWVGKIGETGGVQFPGVPLAQREAATPGQGDHRRVIGAQGHRRTDELQPPPVAPVFEPSP